LGYARVSTSDQDAALQIDALNAAGCVRVFVDTGSGSQANRPGLTRLMEFLRPGDTLAVWRLDRLGRSVQNLIDELRNLEGRQVGFRSLQESIDTTSPGGRLVFHVFAALAEFERDLIRERTVAGLAAPRARGRVGGRPTKLTTDQMATARQLYEQRHMTVTQIGQVLGVSRATVYRTLDKTQAAHPALPPPTRSRRTAAATTNQLDPSPLFPTFSFRSCHPSPRTAKSCVPVPRLLVAAVPSDEDSDYFARLVLSQVMADFRRCAGLCRCVARESDRHGTSLTSRFAPVFHLMKDCFVGWSWQRLARSRARRVCAWWVVRCCCVRRSRWLRRCWPSGVTSGWRGTWHRPQFAEPGIVHNSGRDPACTTDRTCYSAQ
jgi:DNA invertase Pin-like site-specific DNA recombinase